MIKFFQSAPKEMMNYIQKSGFFYGFLGGLAGSFLYKKYHEGQRVHVVKRY